MLARRGADLLARTVHTNLPLDEATGSHHWKTASVLKHLMGPNWCMHSDNFNFFRFFFLMHAQSHARARMLLCYVCVCVCVCVCVLPTPRGVCAVGASSRTQAGMCGDACHYVCIPTCIIHTCVIPRVWSSWCLNKCRWCVVSCARTCVGTRLRANRTTKTRLGSIHMIGWRL